MAEVELTLLIPSTVHPYHASAPHRASLGSGTNLDVTEHHSALGTSCVRARARARAVTESTVISRSWVQFAPRQLVFSPEPLHCQSTSTVLDTTSPHDHHAYEPNFEMDCQ